MENKRTTVTHTAQKQPKKKSLQELEVEREALKAQLDEIARAESFYIEQQQAAQAIANAEIEREYLETVSMAEHFEKLSLQATTEYDKKMYAREAYILRQEAQKIAPNRVVEEQKKGHVEVIDRKSLSILLASFFGFLGLAWLGFDVIRNKILAYNAGLTIENMSSAMQPYGLDSFQKLFFESFVTGVDLLVLFVILFIIDKSSLKYITSFISTEKNPKKEFNELTPWQRQLKTTVLISSCLLYLALRHLVKA